MPHELAGVDFGGDARADPGDGFAVAGLTPPSTTLKNRPRGALAPVQRPTADRLRQLYVQEGLSVAAVAARLDATTHLVRTWLLEDNIPIRPAGGRTGVRRPGRVRKPSPPAAELRRLREKERLSRSELATRYQVHPQTVSGWLTAAGLPGQLPPSVSDAQVAATYRAEPITASEIARRLGIPAGQALAALHREGVEIDPGRQAAAVRAAGVRRRGKAASLPVEQAELAVQYYQDQGWSYRMIGEELGVSHAKVRAELQRRGIPVHRRQPIGPGSRASRAEAPITELRKLYVESEWSAEDVAAQLDSTVHVVLRTAHAHGVPIRQGGGGRPAVTATVALIDSLYGDEQISEVLDRHAVPRRPAGGDIAVRFPDPVPMTKQLLDELYHGAGCSSRGDRVAHRAIPGCGPRQHASPQNRSAPGTHIAGAAAATGGGTARLPGPGRGRISRLRLHRRGGKTARLRHQHRAPLARPSQGHRARPRPLDPPHHQGARKPMKTRKNTDSLVFIRSRNTLRHRLSNPRLAILKILTTLEAVGERGCLTPAWAEEVGDPQMNDL